MPYASEADYWDHDDLEVPASCPACQGSRLTARYLDLVDHEEGIPGAWGMLRCDGCGSLLLSPRPTDGKIGKAYRSYYTHRSPVEENRAYAGSTMLWRWIDGYIFRRYGDALRRPSRVGARIVGLLPPLRQQLDYLYRHLPRIPGSLLDIGCGNGAFLLRARSAGWQVQGIEPDPAAAGQATAQGLVVHQVPVADFRPGGRFDVITLAHVIEHLHAPRAMLDACLGLLKPGGKIWIATPNIGSIGHRLFRSAWQPLETPRHIVMPSPRALRSMLIDAGYENIRFVRRGRGSRKRLDASNQRAIALGSRQRATLPWSMLIDLLASVSPYGAEELVVTAIRPDSRG